MNLVITGTHRGIGKKLAECFLSRGDSVFGCSRHEASVKHENYNHFVADLTDEAAVNEFARTVKKKAGYVDALINNAGIASMNHFLMTPIGTAKNIMSVNYFGAVTVIRAFLNLIKKREHGRIVNFSTVAVALSLEGELAYGSSKATVENLTRVLAKEILALGITVNAVGPAPIRTEIVDGILYIRAKLAMMGYLNAASPFDEDGWFNTKDKVITNEDGYIKILGRTTDLINVGGEKVYPNEVESVLLSADGVKDAHVYGEDNPITGKAVVADIFVDAENNNRDFIRYLRRFCAEHLERFKRPVSFRLTDKAFYGERFKKKR